MPAAATIILPLLVGQAPPLVITMSGDGARTTRGAGGVAANLHPFIPSPHFCEDMFLEGNHKRLNFLNIKYRVHRIYYYRHIFHII